MKRLDFVSHQSLRAELYTLLENPVLSVALEILATEPPSLPSPISGVDYNAQVCVAGARHIGYLEFLRDLRSLTRVPKSQETNEIRESDQALRDVAKSTLVQQGLYSEEELKAYEQSIQASPEA